MSLSFSLECKILAQILTNGYLKQSLNQKFVAVFALFFPKVQENCFQIQYHFKVFNLK